MATNTPRINLVKPDGTDLVDIAVINSNYDKIDANIASTKIQATKPATANAGDLWWDSNTGTLYLYYTDANSSQWVAATSDPVNIGVVDSQASRDAQYPTPGQGMRVYRTDLGAEEAYYGLYNVSTNPGGRTPAGWYQEPVGRILQVVSSVLTTGTQNTTTTQADTGLSCSITPRSSTSKILVLVTHNGAGKYGGDTALVMALVRGSTIIHYPATSHGYSNSANPQISSLSFNFLDSPATTSSITYKTQFSTTVSGVPAYVGYSVGFGFSSATMTLIEVSA